MMNKIIATAVMATVGLSATSANAKVFNGFALGANMGVLLAHSKTKTSKFLQAKGDKRVSSSTDNLGMYGLQLQYDCSKANSFYWGMGLDFNFYNGKNRTSYKYTAANGSTKHINFTNKYKFSNQLDARLGWNIQDKAILYGLVGLKVQKITYSTSGHIVDQPSLKTTQLKKTSRTSTKPILVLGAGAAVKVSDKVSAGIEYRYGFEKSVFYKDKRSNSTTARQDNSSHAILAKVSYHF